VPLATAAWNAPVGHAPELLERYECLRDRAVAGATMTLAMRMLIDRGVHAWIEAFGSPSCSPTPRAAMPDAGARPPTPTQLVSLLATLVANVAESRTREVHA